MGDLVPTQINRSEHGLIFGYVGNTPEISTYYISCILVHMQRVLQNNYSFHVVMSFPTSAFTSNWHLGTETNTPNLFLSLENGGQPLDFLGTLRQTKDFSNLAIHKDLTGSPVDPTKIRWFINQYSGCRSYVQRSRWLVQLDLLGCQFFRDPEIPKQKKLLL